MHHAMRATFAFAMTIAEHWHFSDFGLLLGIEPIQFAPKSCGSFCSDAELWD